MKYYRLILVGVVIASLSAFTAYAQSGPLNVTLTPSRNSGVSGTATLTESNGQVNVMVSLQGLPANTAHAGHIHNGGTCADDRAGNGKPVQFPFPAITADASGKGSMTTTITSTLAALADGKHYINYHEAASPPGAGITCADIVAAPASLPTTGGDSTPYVPLAAAGGALLLGGLVLSRRRTA